MYDRFSPRATQSILFALILSALVVQAWLLHDWVVDDAAISFAYARNLWLGNGLIAQVGASPVEGFSNPLWVLILSPITWLPDVATSTKLLALIFVATAAYRLSSIAERTTNSVTGWVAGLLLVVQPSVTIWAQSGLENSLTLLLGVELLDRLLRLSGGDLSKRIAIEAGFICTAIALTRPEGIVFSALFPLVAILTPRSSQRDRFNSSLIACAIPLVAALLYEAFRWSYFGALVPNTYLAKGGVTLARVRALLVLDPYVLEQWNNLSCAVFGDVVQSWGMLVTCALVVIAWMKDHAEKLRPSVLMFATAMVLVVLLPTDWMPENRLATFVFPPLYFLLALALTSIGNAKVRIVFAALFVCYSASIAVPRYENFLYRPTISITEVEERSEIFERWGAMLGSNRPSLLTADVGGILWLDRVQVIDLGMLVNRPIAEALGEARPTMDKAVFHQYIFSDVRPDFIATRAYHAWIADFDMDPRFRQDYVPIKEYVDTWVLERRGVKVYAGDFVKKSLVDTNPDQFQVIKNEAGGLFYPFCGDCVKAQSDIN